MLVIISKTTGYQKPKHHNLTFNTLKTPYLIEASHVHFPTTYSFMIHFNIITHTPLPLSTHFLRQILYAFLVTQWMIHI